MPQRSRPDVAYVLIIHEVADIDAWRVVFERAAGLRRDAGERAYQVLVDATAPDVVVHFSSWTSLDAARAFFQSPELEAIRAEAGVRAPEFRYLDELTSGTL